MSTPYGDDIVRNSLEIALPRWRLYVALGAAAFGLLFAGTAAGWLVFPIRATAVAAMALLIALWVRAIVRRSDLIDALTIIALLAVSASTLTSTLPRLSAEGLYAAGAFAAVFGLTRRMDSTSRTAAVGALGLIGAVLAVLFAALWITTWGRWFSLTGALPSLALRLPSAPFGHPHDVAILIGLLLPACAIGAANGTRIVRAAAVATVAICVLVVLMSGGRAMWAGALLATVVALAARWRHWHLAELLRDRRVLAAMAVMVVAAVVLAILFGAQLLHRILTAETLGLRADMWASALVAWVRQPVLGTGPATFQFVLQPTGYFDTATYAPKHADSLYIQALVELGLVSVTALIALAAMIGRAWMSAPPPVGAVWALVFAAIVGLASNPVIAGSGALLVVFWAGLSVPIAEPRTTEAARRGRWPTIAAAVVLVALAVPLTTTTLAVMDHEDARARAAGGDMAGALDAMEGAVRLDPTFPLYQRELGAIRLSLAQPASALTELQAAAELNRADDSIWRALAYAALATGDPERALGAAREAVRLQGTESLNQATLAYMADAAGDVSARDVALQQVVTLSEWTSADPAWTDAFGPFDPEITKDAARASVVSPVPTGADGRWLDVFSGVTPDAAADGYTTAQLAFSDLIACDINQAVTDLSGGEHANAADHDYWLAHWVAFELAGRSEPTALDALVMLTGPVRQEGHPLYAPLVDEAAYGRLPVVITFGPKLPSPDDGVRAWINDPETSLTTVRGGRACP